MYKPAVPLFLFLFQIAGSSQAQQVLSLQPLFTEQNAVLLTETETSWGSPDSYFSITIKKTGDNFYRVRDMNPKVHVQYEAVFVPLGNIFFLDLTPLLPDTLGDGDYRSQLLPAHSLFKVNITADTLRFSGLSYKWFYDHFATSDSSFAHSWTRSGLILTEATGKLRQFLEKNINEPGFFEDPVSLVRKQPPATEKKGTRQVPADDAGTKKIFQPCIPVFPHKDGWLGGDADVAIPLNNSRTLYLFGDTYVGQKNSTRKSGNVQMVSSSLAVSSCRPGGKQDINYYWRNMYTQHPEPIFQSFTGRYNFWIIDGFLYKNCLYALLQKTGPKIGGSPDDFFNFSPLGFSLAKVVNPATATPDKWQPEYRSFHFWDGSFGSLHVTLVRDSSYLYLFAEDQGKIRLLRIPISFIDSSDGRFEYYSLSHDWKKGIRSDDMDILFTATLGSTIKYHDDIKKWVMVCGPGFQNNRIGIRTAPSLTGPWSAETIVYECPEITPGTASYKRSNFGYLGRECIQHYDTLSKTMVITYDINSTDFQSIQSNPEIYTPKVITVSLAKYGIH